MAHRLIEFRAGPSGRRQPAVFGTRLYVHQIIATVRAADGNVADAAEYLNIAPRKVRAAIAYYADHRAAIDADADHAANDALDERARRQAWRRRVLGDAGVPERVAQIEEGLRRAARERSNTVRDDPNIHPITNGYHRRVARALEDLEQIATLLRSGKTVNEAAAISGLPEYTVRRLARILEPS